ncbi:helix-turn-helix transcriptional regulator [Bradyrhizobium sp. CB3481]|nr:helix-turn-helix transcriptional regulator [Bradyrhizobium sp. CB3481]WFU20632.1 helix-turn-helix transcriptional regulator [Bradyrhizobium sp. CB3481]
MSADPSLCPEDDVKLSERETECLRFAAEGRSSWSIGKELRISEHTINFHIKNARQKIGVRTRVQGILKAVSVSFQIRKSSGTCSERAAFAPR